MKSLLAVCMIVRDEEKVLDRCLQSIYEIADEIVVVDTGSEDRTKEIASKYTDKVHDFKWIQDFAKARNYAASKAISEWILVLDADEYVDRKDFKRFKETLKSNPPQNEINSIQIYNFTGDKAQATALNRHSRLYKNNGKIEYYRPIHELLRHKDGPVRYGLADLTVFHTGYMKGTVEEKEKSERNLSILLEQEKKTGIDY